MRWLLLIISLIFLAVLYLVRWGLIVVTVQQRSMLPALNPGDRVLVARHWPKRWLRKGQIVILWPSHVSTPYPNDPTSGTPFIKRIVGISNDNVVTSIDEMHGALQPQYISLYNSEGKRSWHIPPEHVFVLGDHIPRGIDSLTWGPVPVQNISGVVLLKLAPIPGTKGIVRHNHDIH
jgi:signal peptidase I